MIGKINLIKRHWLNAGVASAISFALILGTAGCKKNAGSTDNPAVADNGSDPAAANEAPVSGQVLGASQEGTYNQQGESYPQSGPAPIVRQAPPGDYSQDQNADQYNSDVDAGQVALTADEPPPPLPVYQQPEAPDPNDMWTPGYWDYGQGGYYWVPGVWVAAPYYGALWTPPWWGFYGGHYGFHRGYWGMHIGFYGGINYGFGYIGHGYEGGYWHGNQFYYNRSVNRVNVNVIHNVYEHNVTVVNNTRVSYNGGRGGLNVRPQPAEMAALHEQHTPPMTTQVQHAQQAAGDRQQFFAENHGRPAAVVATAPIAAERGVRPPAAAPAAERGGFGQPRVAPQQAHPEPAQRGAPQAQPQARPEPQQVHPAQPQHVEPQPQRVQPQPQARPQPQPQIVHPQPQSRPEHQPQIVHPQPQPRPEPAARPAPQAQPAPRPAPAPAAHPGPAPRPAAQPRPAPQPHPQPAAHPPAHEEEHH